VVSERCEWLKDLEAHLGPGRYEIRRVSRIQEAETGPAVDLILIDASQPEQDAVALYRSAPPARSTPVILMTAAYTEHVVAEALEAGADCCLSTAVSPRELAAWIQALLRRRATPVSPPTGRLVLGAVTIDLARGQVEKGGASVTLSPTQLLLLRALAERPGQVVRREYLLTKVLGPRQRRKMSTLHVHLFQLRALIEEDPGRPRFLKTVRAIGYLLAVEPRGEEDSR
jgi:DNA-binding response OmpR family regulator